MNKKLNQLINELKELTEVEVVEAGDNAAVVRLKEFGNEEYQLHSYDWCFVEAVEYAVDMEVYDFDFLVDLRIEIREQFNHYDDCHKVAKFIANYFKYVKKNIKGEGVGKRI